MYPRDMEVETATVRRRGNSNLVGSPGLEVIQFPRGKIDLRGKPLGSYAVETSWLVSSKILLSKVRMTVIPVQKRFPEGNRYIQIARLRCYKPRQDTACNQRWLQHLLRR
jgi:hypothetical protein